ncbi:MAG: hypothetical protein KC449_28225 [Anaerolineales bacterium]|nr:hypothetical protein [Anaerolineales bacterium]
MTMPDRAQLRQFLQQYYSDDELETLVFDYFREVGEQFTIGMTRPQKVRELIGYAERRGVLPNLVAALAVDGWRVLLTGSVCWLSLCGKLKVTRWIWRGQQPMPVQLGALGCYLTFPFA